jgi:hypothetical protein
MAMMRSRTGPTCRPGRRAGRTALAVAAALLGAGGCVDINGGSVEVAWGVFAKDGRAINDCACAVPLTPPGTETPIAFVRLDLVSDSDPADQPCAGNDGCRFSCNRKIGATPFMVPPGRYLMSLVPVDASGADFPAGSVDAPPAELRSVVKGQPTELDAFMLQARCATRCNKGGNMQPCGG